MYSSPWEVDSHSETRGLRGLIRLMGKSARLYFHSPCFDGIVSAVVASDFLEVRRSWVFECYCAVDYGQRTNWLSRSLGKECAVVDFIYHPQATFWADHHSTTFLSATERRDFIHRRHGRTLFYDARLGSCSMLLWQALKDRFSYRNEAYSDMVEWADKIDSARYSSVTEAVLGEAPALRIRASLSADGEPGFFEHLVKTLRVKTLDEVANLPEVDIRSKHLRSKIEAGLERLKYSIWVDESGIAVFDVDESGVAISRYAPYVFFPDARYSAGIVRSKSGTKITAMRNPWRDFPSVKLGKIFERFGGGGHERVGSVLIPEAVDARTALHSIVDQIRSEDAPPHFRESRV